MTTSPTSRPVGSDHKPVRHLSPLQLQRVHKRDDHEPGTIPGQFESTARRTTRRLHARRTADGDRGDRDSLLAARGGVDERTRHVKGSGNQGDDHQNQHAA